jgi:hypothetical protein
LPVPFYLGEASARSVSQQPRPKPVDNAEDKQVTLATAPSGEHRRRCATTLQRVLWAVGCIFASGIAAEQVYAHDAAQSKLDAIAADAAQACVDQINGFRASVGRGPLARNSAQEACVSGESQTDGQANTAHASFGQCRESGQCECPGWNGDPATVQQTIAQCLQSMWDEGPGGGHHDIIMSDSYQSVACGYAFVNGSLWATQSFFF